jgi:hypothetical protein
MSGMNFKFVQGGWGRGTEVSLPSPAVAGYGATDSPKPNVQSRGPARVWRQCGVERQNSARYTGGDIAAQCPYQNKVNRGDMRGSQNLQCDFFREPESLNASSTYSTGIDNPVQKVPSSKLQAPVKFQISTVNTVGLGLIMIITIVTKVPQISLISVSSFGFGLRIADSRDGGVGKGSGQGDWSDQVQTRQARSKQGKVGPTENQTKSNQIKAVRPGSVGLIADYLNFINLCGGLTSQGGSFTLRH